jgi:hypothetical protein
MNRPRNRRHPDVINAFAVGAVFCHDCDGVHVDLVDERMNVLATGFLNFGQFLVMTNEVINQEEADAHHRPPPA